MRCISIHPIHPLHTIHLSYPKLMEKSSQIIFYFNIMFHNFSKRLFSTLSSKVKFSFSNITPRNPTIFKYAQRALMISVPAYFAYNYLTKTQVKTQSYNPDPINQQFILQQELKYLEKPTTVFQKITSLIRHAIRFMHLLWIFMPTLILLPLHFFKATDHLWLTVFVNSIQRAGVVMIKAFQYLSHRRDVIGPEMADHFVHLRENAPQHSFEQTKKNFKQAYGKQIDQIFDDFDPIPFASGSVSQVYRAKINGRKVAVKVRHPQVDKYIQRDVNILFFISRVLSKFSKSFQIPVGEESLKRTLIQQIDFNIERQNLDIFNRMFAGSKDVYFPQSYKNQTRDSVLVQSYVEGVPITYFQKHKHPLNGVIARQGVAIFFQMLIKNNFIHADCHGGNIIIELQQKSSTFFSQIKEYFQFQLKRIQLRLKEELFQNSDTLKKLYKASREQQQSISKIVRECTDKAKITLIDVGMVIRLNETDQQNFISFIKSLMQGESSKCAQLIYNLSNFQGKKLLNAEAFSSYLQELKSLFSILERQTIFQLENMDLLIGMLNIIRDNKMKLDGQFATLLTNMVVLQAMAKEIDPSIVILKCAVPFFGYIDQNKSQKDMQKFSKVSDLVA